MQAATRIDRTTPEFCAAVAGVEPDAAALRSTLERFVDGALRFVIRVRKQEHAVRIWMLDAFHRDRGTVD